MEELVELGVEVIPIWALFLITIAISFLALEIGYRFGVRALKQHTDMPATSATIVQSTLALLAFLLAFTFGIAADRFNERRELLVDAANTIGKFYFRTDLMKEPLRSEVREVLREYIILRWRAYTDAGTVEHVKENSIDLQEKFWAKVMEYARANMDSDLAALVVESANEVIDVQSKRLATAVYAPVPTPVWLVLYMLLFMSFGLAGYESGCHKTRSLLGDAALALSFTLVVTLVVDLDHPMEGFLQTNRQPLEDMAKRIGALK